MRTITLLASVILLGASSSDGTVAPPGREAGGWVPALVAVELQRAATEGVDVRWHRLALNPSGYAAYFVSDEAAPLITILDSTGHQVGGAAAFGEGPGENSSDTVSNRLQLYRIVDTDLTAIGGE